ncbi:carbon storage regulator [Desulfofundulus luciae]|uniref:Translational regulator CsrA n=1 Tax=Desulfofundulus luciae TaxID=74702 RepID=A0ABU0AYS8_9FIRM|nr:carbon storage regulator CsrA [Desulfofundulus luciae]MDQ0285626.1 carbon storage regulator [Desulfofundulus luciae]
MLVLTRKKGQSLVIGRDIRVVVVEVTGDFVRLGIEAPPEVAVYREEIYRTVQEENRAATTSAKILKEIKGQVKRS